jgi:uncharacterized membrane protein YeaQ/YmgE (transglycosylase-associated protein family)
MRDLVMTIVIGLIAGGLASIVVGGGGILRYIITGIIGAFVGGYLFAALGIRLGISNALVERIVTSMIGAIVVVFLARMIA